MEYNLDRYQKIRGKSPFEFELAKPPVGETVDPFADYVLAGFAGSASRPTVYLMNTKTQERITVSSLDSAGKSKHGFSLISLNRGRVLRSTTARMEKDGQQKDLAFDTAVLSNMVGGTAGGAATQLRPGQPGQPGQLNAAGRPGMPMAQTRPAVQPFQAPQAFIPNRPAAASPQMQPGQPGQPQTVQFQAQPGAPGAVNPQQQINTLLQTNAPQPMINPPGSPQPAGPGAVPGNPQPRRRVVLPTPTGAP